MFLQPSFDLALTSLCTTLGNDGCHKTTVSLCISISQPAHHVSRARKFATDSNNKEDSEFFNT